MHQLQQQCLLFTVRHIQLFLFHPGNLFPTHYPACAKIVQSPIDEVINIKDRSFNTNIHHFESHHHFTEIAVAA